MDATAVVPLREAALNFSPETVLNSNALGISLASVLDHAWPGGGAMSVRFHSPELSEADDFYAALERYVRQHVGLSRHARLHHYRNFASLRFI